MLNGCECYLCHFIHDENTKEYGNACPRCRGFMMMGKYEELKKCLESEGYNII